MTTRTLIACVGALIPRKGQELVLQALARLPGVHCAFVGTGPDRERLRQLAYELDLPHRAHFLGSLDHGALPTVLAASEAMVLPSASEGLANAWVEALACGTPLVITDAGGARELVTGPSAGRIVARDAEAIVQGVREVLAADYPPEASRRKRRAIQLGSERGGAGHLLRKPDRPIGPPPTPPASGRE